MARTKMLVHGEFFSTKKELIERCKSILHSYALEPAIGINHAKSQPLKQQDVDFLTSMIKDYHPEGELKIGVGVKSMWVGEGGYGSKGFYLEREDGTTTDWSFIKCANRPSGWNNFNSACRKAVNSQITDYKSEQFRKLNNIKCCFTGDTLFIHTSHADHVPPRTFNFLLKEFLKESKINYSEVALTPTQDNKMGQELADEEFSRRWCNFHKANAVYRLLSSEGNLVHSKLEAKAVSKVTV